jgi:pimeloyl-ACP methyl ester carboxylesterase
VRFLFRRPRANIERMENLRTYGNPPFSVAVLHGGPGAPGEMVPVARKMSATRGVLEPLQTSASVEGQIQELHDVLTRNATLPLTLVGWSWGAWLGFIFTARYPDMVQRLVLVGSPPFEAKYAAGILDTRLRRLPPAEKSEALSLLKALGEEATPPDAILARLGELFGKSDAYDPLPDEAEAITCRADIYRQVWSEAETLRRSGKLLELGTEITCPVTAIHGAYDPHPAAGVSQPLGRVLRSFRFYLLEKCGHRPWRERAARDRFYRLLCFSRAR